MTLEFDHSRNQRSEQKYLKLAIKYQALAKKHREMEKAHQRKLTHKTSRDWVRVVKSPTLHSRQHRGR